MKIIRYTPLAWFLALLLGLPSLPVLAGMSDPAEEEITEEKSSSWIVLPVLFRTPETGFAAGVMVNHIFRLSPAYTDGKPSSMLPMVIYTEEEQMIAQMFANLYLANDAYWIRGHVGYYDFPSLFYGIGNDTEETNEEEYTYRTLRLEMSFQRRFADDLYLGLGFDFKDHELLDVEQGGILDQGDIPGSNGGTIGGLLALMTYDSRDHHFFPSRGFHVEFRAGLFDSALGSDFHYQEYRLDARSYQTLAPRHVLALQLFSQSLHGSAPFQEYAEIGGQFLLRGIYGGRFRDRASLVVQAEYRLELGKRWGLAAFAGAGRVGEDPGDLFSGDLKIAGGGGVRYMVNRKERMYLRLDVGFSEDDTGVYLSIGEAF
ncbi:MAG TPA: BamA/TamA family outer membrane protein [Thermoanaerobaculia bacterium]|nr:BamA/TamA family outer membrane protein [Thermoanaerobaculia bacterium]HUM29026.1 BamA/TamA family outer membrane protein [Thermoanaerobaculia bacterium]HXK67418.1 BamA/TamA family outer membrane protein [Thermoanaerobaculia bacterium]